MNQIVLQQEEEKEDKKVGFFISLMVHILLLLLLLLPCLSYMDPPPDLQGVTVIFGDPDAGVQAESAPPVKAAAAASPAPSKTKAVEKTPVKPTESKVVDVVSKTTEETSEVIATKKKIISTPVKEEPKIDPEELARKKAEAAEKERQRLEEQKAKAEAEEAARKAAEEAAKQKKYEDAKSKFGNMFGKGGATGGTTEGQKGDPLGKPDATALEGISTGSGRVGGGLSNRGVIHEPNFNDNSQKKGIVVIKICVDSKGNVIEARFTQKGSTTTDNYLVDLAEKQVKKYKFSPSDNEEQCGTITVDFKIK